MQTYVAEVGEVVRAQRRDEEHLRDVEERVSNVLRELAGQRTWLRYYPRLAPSVRFVYYAVTTLRGIQTLGEEYLSLIQVEDPIARRLPSFLRRLVFVVCESFLPVIAETLLNKATHSLNHPSTRSFLGVPLKSHGGKARLNFIILVQWLRETLLPQLGRIHLALFYLVGTYYNISKRAAGVRYLSLSAQSDSQVLKLYRWLGWLTLAQCLVSLLIWLISTLEEERTENKPLAVEDRQESEEDEQEETSFRCQICLEHRPPSCTPCGHVFCWSCILAHAHSSVDESTESEPFAVSRCPQCRSPFQPNSIVPLLNL